MQRDEAVTYLKEIFDCSSMSPNAIYLEESKNRDKLTGYKIHIKGAMSNGDKEVVIKIAKKHNFEVKEEKDEVIIYKPKVVANSLP